MGIVLFHLQFYRLGMGMLLCFCAETPLGKPRIYVRADAADLWIRSACGLDQYDQSQRQYSVDLFIRHGWSNAVGIRYRGGYGETFQCEILGLQQSEIKFVHVPIEGAVLKIPTIIAEGIAFVLTVAAAVDVTQSFNDAMDLKRILAQLEESKKQIRKIQEKLKVASEEFVEDYRQRAGEFVEDYRQRAGEFVEDYRRRVEEHVEDYRGRAEEMAEDYKKLAEEHMDSYRQRAEEMVEGYKEEIKVQKKKRREQINSRKEEYLARVHARREERQRLLARLSERAELLMKEEFTSKVDELIGEDKREEYAKIKKNISREMTKMHDRTDRSYIRAARHLKGNPTAVSKRFSEALAELRKHMDEK